MANNLTFNIEQDLDLEGTVGEIAAIYQSRGYNVRMLKMKNGAKLTIEKGVGGINMILGMGEAITATFTII